MKQDPVRVFSTFSGIGGFELGIQRAYSGLVNQPRKGDTVPIGQEAQYGAGVDNQLPTEYTGDSTERSPQATCIGYSEIDKYAIKVYERHFEHENYGDATTINAKELPDFDLLVGGFPCQAFSVAGKRGGFNDTRGTLFFDIARILKEKRPRHLLLENVKGLLSHDKGKTFSTILGVLSDLGYRVEWQVLDSKDFGVPQNRERVFIIGHSRNECRRQVFPIAGTNRADTFVRTVRAGGSQSTTEKHARDIIQVNQPKHSNDRVYAKEGLSPTLNTMQGGRRQPFVAMTERRTEEAKRIRRESQKKGRDYSPRRGKKLVPRDDAVGNTVTAGQPKEHLLTNGARIRRLTPLECERLQGFPDGWTKYGVGDEPISDTQRYKMCGNAVTVNVIESIIRNFDCLNK